MVELSEELIGKLDREEITNLQCIQMHGQEVKDFYKKWCPVLGFAEGDEEGAEQFINELRYGDEPDDEWTPEMWSEFRKAFDEAWKESMEEEEKYVPMELFNKWRKDRGLMATLKKSENAAKITLWRYQNLLGKKQTCAKALGITRNNVKQWWDVPVFINEAIAEGGHVHPIRLELDVIKQTILNAVEKAEEANAKELA